MEEDILNCWQTVMFRGMYLWTNKGKSTDKDFIYKPHFTSDILIPSDNIYIFQSFKYFIR